VTQQEKNKIYYEQNKTVINLRNKRYREENKVRIKDIKMKSMYGISLEEYEELKLKQEYCCKLCKTSFNDCIPVIDHCHETGKIRGVLCNTCNITLGLMGDSLDKITQKYLQYKEYLT
jgi:hypothetical protein